MKNGTRGALQIPSELIEIPGRIKPPRRRPTQGVAPLHEMGQGVGVSIQLDVSADIPGLFEQAGMIDFQTRQWRPGCGDHRSWQICWRFRKGRFGFGFDLDDCIRLNVEIERWGQNVFGNRGWFDAGIVRFEKWRAGLPPRGYQAGVAANAQEMLDRPRSLPKALGKLAQIELGIEPVGRCPGLSVTDRDEVQKSILSADIRISRPVPIAVKQTRHIELFGRKRMPDRVGIPPFRAIGRHVLDASHNALHIRSLLSSTTTTRNADYGRGATASVHARSSGRGAVVYPSRPC